MAQTALYSVKEDFPYLGIPYLPIETVDLYNLVQNPLYTQAVADSSWSYYGGGTATHALTVDTGVPGFLYTITAAGSASSNILTQTVSQASSSIVLSCPGCTSTSGNPAGVFVYAGQHLSGGKYTNYYTNADSSWFIWCDTSAAGWYWYVSHTLGSTTPNVWYFQSNTVNVIAGSWGPLAGASGTGTTAVQGTSWAAGDVLAFSGRIKTSGLEVGGSTVSISLVATPSSTQIANPMMGWQLDLDGAWYMTTSPIPVGTTSIAVTIQVSAGSGVVSVGQVGVVNMTQNPPPGSITAISRPAKHQSTSGRIGTTSTTCSSWEDGICVAP